MPHRARYGALTAFAVSAALLHCGNESFNGAGNDAGGQDAAGDATSQDGTISEGSIGDGNTSFDGAFVFDDPCTASAHSYCCDFDDGGINSFFDASQTSNGSLALASDIVQSPPQSLHTKANPTGGYAYGRAFVPGGRTQVTCSFDLYIQQLNGAGHNIFSVSIDNIDSKGITLVINPDTDGGAKLQLFGTLSSTDAGGFVPGTLSLPIRAWMRLQVNTTLPGTGQLTGKVDALSFDAGPPLQILTNIISVNSFEIAVGFDYVGTGNGDAYIDNVACDAL